ncbi:hypothetical protein V3W47_02310 [Deinococcus sp. YIM 134068]|uniref:hypothetical protein n=1 Tax=Deinococcus lichenicola TaxID=3118910 RepID=UPI002F9410EE
MKPRIWVDFNNRDEQNCLCLSTNGSIEDLTKFSQVESGMVVTAHGDEIEVDVLLERDGSVWVGVMISEYRDTLAKNG